MNRIAQIQNLTRLWHEATQVEGGGSRIGEHTECYRLSRNGIAFHQLQYDEILPAIGYVTSTLLLPGLNSVVTQDHLSLIAWCQQVILDRNHISQSPLENRNYHKMAEICSSLELIDFHSGSEINRSTEWLTIMGERGMIIACLAFPLLEGGLKICCSDFVTIDGVVKQDFEISLVNRNNETYKHKQKAGDKISSLKVLLQLYHELVASHPAKEAVSIIKNSLSRLHPQVDPMQLIYDWRNSTLHGADSFSTIGGTILGLTFIVEISKEKDNYEDFRKQTIENCRFKSKSESPMWYFYKHPL